MDQFIYIVTGVYKMPSCQVHYLIQITLEKPTKKNTPCITGYCRTHNVRVCLYIVYIACGSSSLYIKTLYFFPTVLALSAAATVANIKIRYDAKTPQFAIFWTHVIFVFYSNSHVYGDKKL